MPEGETGQLPVFYKSAHSGLRRLVQRVASLSGLSIAGQATFLIALPLLLRLYGPAAIGQFTIYLSLANIAGPIVGCKFEAALFGIKSREDRRVSLALAVLTSVVNGIFLAAVARFAAPWTSDNLGVVVLGFFPLLPIGFALSGIWGAATAWAIREEELGILGAARFIQPAAMTALQLIFGMLDLPAPWLALAHVISHTLYSGTIFIKTLSHADRQAFLKLRFMDLYRRALCDGRYPLFAMPAFAVTMLIGNAPPLLLGALFGLDVAGQYGVAFRVVTAPLTILCQPLGHLFLSEASRGERARTRDAAQFALLTSIAIALPLLIICLLAPTLSARLLGPSWMLAGDFMAALAAMGAAQAIAAPFHDVPSLYRRPELRLGTDTILGILFFLPLAIGVSEQWSAKSTVQLMAAGGAVGYGLSAVTTLFLVRAKLALPAS